MIKQNILARTDTCWTTSTLSIELFNSSDQASLKKTERWVAEQSLDFKALDESTLVDEHERPAKQLVTTQICERARKKRNAVLFAAIHEMDRTLYLAANDGRSVRRWVTW